MTTLSTMYPAQTNSPTTSLTGALTDSAVTVNVADASVFSGLTPPFEATIGVQAVLAETVIVTAVNGNALTVIRGWDGAAVSWPIGTLIARTLSAKDVNDIQGNIKALNDGKCEIDGYYASLGAGVADNLAGHGDGVGAEFTYRTAGGDADIGTGRAALKSINGNSIIWNQGAPALSSWSGSNAAVSVTNNVATLTASASSGFAYAVISPARAVGHKYLISALIKLTTATNQVKLLLSASTSAYQFATANSTAWQRVSGIAQINSETANQNMQIRDMRASGFDAIQFAMPMCIDLTRMFGVGNEPTTADEFIALYPGFYEFNAGELVNFSASALDTVGFNLLETAGRSAVTANNAIDSSHRAWDDGSYYVYQGLNNYYDNTRVASYDVGNGVISVTTATAAGGYGVAFPVRVFPGKQYFLNYTATGSPSCRIYWYGADGLFLGSSDNVVNFASYFTAPTYAYWAVIYFAAAGNSTATYTDITLNLSWSHWRDGETAAFWRSSLALPITDYFPGGMKSAGAVADELTATTAIQRIMAVDLGALTWTRTSVGSGYVFVSNAVSDMADGTAVLCAPYIYAAPDGGDYANMADQTVCSATDGTAAIVIRDDSYSTAAAFAAALDGVNANVELASQVVTTFAEPLELGYAVDDFGTEKAVSSSISAPMICLISYALNAVDTIRRLPTQYISKASFDNFIAALETFISATVTETWDSDTNCYTYEITASA